MTTNSSILTPMLLLLLLLLPTVAPSQITWSDIDTATYMVVDSGVLTDASVTAGIDSYVIEFTQKGECLRWELDFITEEDGMRLYVDANGEYYYVDDKLQFVMVGTKVVNGRVRKYVFDK